MSWITYAFMQKALISGILVSIVAALIGVILVLKQHALLGHGLGDVGFGALSIAIVLNMQPLLVSIPVVVIAAFFTLYISQKRHINGDALIGMIASSALALGMIATTMNGGFNVNVSNLLFGSILVMTSFDFIVSCILAIIIIIAYVLCYKAFLFITLDSDYATATGFKVQRYEAILAILTALTVVLGMRIMGTLLISSLLIFPAMSAKYIARSYFQMVLFSVIISTIAFTVGLIASFYFNLPTGPTVVIAQLSAFILLTIFKKLMSNRFKIVT